MIMEVCGVHHIGTPLIINTVHKSCEFTKDVGLIIHFDITLVSKLLWKITRGRQNMKTLDYCQTEAPHGNVSVQ